jgi:hypothetical protein
MPHTTSALTRVDHLPRQNTHNPSQLLPTHTGPTRTAHLHAADSACRHPMALLPSRHLTPTPPWCARARKHARTHARSLPPSLSPCPKASEVHAWARALADSTSSRVTDQRMTHDIQRAASNTYGEGSVAKPQEMVVCVVQ